MFTASQLSASGGQQITLNWESNGEVARIDQINQANAITASFSVTPTGQLPITVPNNDPQVRYRLTIQRGGQEATAEVTITVQLVCTQPWFFAGINQTPANCPAGPPQTVNGSYQPFQNGFMANLIINGENRVYGFNSRNLFYAVYISQWDGVTVHQSGCGTAPAGFVDPQGVFNWLYHTQLGTVGLWCDTNNGIGWATAGASNGVVMTFQFEAAPSQAFYLNIQNVGTFRLTGTPNTGSWSFLPPLQ